MRLSSSKEIFLKDIFFLAKKYTFAARSGYSVVRLSRLLWEQEVASSNLAIPTLKIKHLQQCFFLFHRH